MLVSEMANILPRAEAVTGTTTMRELVSPSFQVRLPVVAV
jgi:hypothetical protein